MLRPAFRPGPDRVCQVPPPVRSRMSGLLAACLAAGLVAAAAPRPAAAEAWPLVAATLVGGPGAESIEAVGIQSDGTIVAAGHGDSLDAGVAATPLEGSGGFVARLAADGRTIKTVATLGIMVDRLVIAPDDSIYVLGMTRGTVGDVTDYWAVAKLAKDASAIEKVFKIWKPKKGCRADFDLDPATGNVVINGGGWIVCLGPDGAELWKAEVPAHGDSRSFEVARDPKRGTLFSIGYGMTHTGKEPWKDPYLHSFASDGRLLDTLWNPDPKDQKSAKLGGTGLMADGTGCFVDATPTGKLLAIVFHDGGNAVTTRNPRNPREPLDSKVMEGVFQNGPGWGMKGAIKTCVCFRIDPADPKALALEKGTWMCAWLDNHKRANGLLMVAAAGDGEDRAFIVGSSASDCPVKDPWFPWREQEYKGNGFLAAFDRDFKMLRCGTFASTDLKAVATRNGVVVAGGRAKPHKPESPDEAVKTTPGGRTAVAGDSDGYLVVIRER